VASVAGEAARIVRDSGGGFVARPGDPQSLAAEISRALNLSAAERAERGARARSYVQSHYSRAALARRYLEILRGVARQG
jgi:glycosyltransferase involved in cell wall biosynthesis